MIKKIMYISFDFIVTIKPNNIELKNINEVNYNIELDCITSNAISKELSKKYEEDKYIVDRFRNSIREHIRLIEEEKNIIINVDDWEFQIDLENIDNLSELDIDSKKELLKEKDIMISINSEELNDRFDIEDLEDLIQIRETLF